MNGNKEINALSLPLYMQKRIPEEDYPIHVEESLQDNYQKIDQIYETFFDSNFLTMAKVLKN